MTAGGIVLCGGNSSRMGRPKAWLPFAGETMLQRIVRTMQEVVGPLVVVAAPDQELPPLPEDVLIARDEKRGRGPLQGLGAGLATMDGRAEVVYVSSCDVPFLTPAFVSRIIELVGDHNIAVPLMAGIAQPLAAAYRVSLLPQVVALLERDQLKMTNLFVRCQTRFVQPEQLFDVDLDLLSLRNVNTPQEYNDAVRLWNASQTSRLRSEPPFNDTNGTAGNQLK